MDSLRERQIDYDRNPAPANYWTVASRCVERKIVLSRGGLIQAGRRASAGYQARYGEKAPRAPEIVQFKDLGNAELIATTYVFAYSEDALDLLDEAIDQALVTYGGPKDPA